MSRLMFVALLFIDCVAPCVGSDASVPDAPPVDAPGAGLTRFVACDYFERSWDDSVEPAPVGVDCGSVPLCPWRGTGPSWGSERLSSCEIGWLSSCSEVLATANDCRYFTQMLQAEPCAPRPCP